MKYEDTAKIDSTRVIFLEINYPVLKETHFKNKKIKIMDIHFVSLTHC